MELWRTEILNKFETIRHTASNGKEYVQCPYCDALEDYNRYVYKDSTEEKIKPAVMYSSFVYVPRLDYYGIMCFCCLCNKKFYTCYDKNNDSLVFIDDDKTKISETGELFVEKICKKDRKVNVFINSVLTHNHWRNYCSDKVMGVIAKHILDSEDGLEDETTNRNTKGI